MQVVVQTDGSGLLVRKHPRRHVIGGGTASVNVQIAGPDLATLNQISDQVIATLSTIPGMADVQNSSNAGNPELHIQLDPARMAQLNVNAQTVATALRTAVSGSVVSAYRPTGATQLDITLVANDAQRMNLAAISNIPVGTGTATGAGAATTGSGATGAATSVTSGTSMSPCSRTSEEWEARSSSWRPAWLSAAHKA